MDVVVGYASAPGHAAREGTGRNSYFTAALLTHISESGAVVDVAHLLRLVRHSVLHHSRGTQSPWFNSALSDRAVFILGDDGAPMSVDVSRAFPEEVPLLEVFVGREEVVDWVVGDALLGSSGGGGEVVSGSGEAPSASQVLSAPDVLTGVSDTGAGVHDAVTTATTTTTAAAAAAAIVPCATADAVVPVTPVLDGRVSVVSGLGGVGKSAIAREVCRVARRRLLYPSGIFWVNADSLVSLDRSLRTMAVRAPLSMHRFRDASARAEEVREAVSQWLASHPGWLLVLDNADDPAVVRPYVPTGAAAAAGHVLLTSRASREVLVEAGVMGSGVEVWRVGTLDVGPALSMLASVMRGAEVTGEEVAAVLGGAGSAELDAATWVVGPEGVGGLPLAVQQAGAHMAQVGMSCVEYAARYREVETAVFGGSAGSSTDGSANGAVDTRRRQVDAWLGRHGLGECSGPLAALGVSCLSDLSSLQEGDLDDLASVPVLRRRQLWRAISEPPGVFEVDEAREREVRGFLSGVLRLSEVGCDAVLRGCDVRRLDDLREPRVRDRVAACAGLGSRDKDVVLRAMDSAGGVPLEARLELGYGDVPLLGLTLEFIRQRGRGAALRRGRDVE